MNRMRKLVASLVGAAVVGTSCLVAMPDGATATPLPLTVVCEHHICIASGGLGNLVGATLITDQTPPIGLGIVCAGLTAPCSLGIAELEVTPTVLAAVFSNALIEAGAVLTLHFVLIAASAGGQFLEVYATNRVGYITLTPGIHKCLVIHGLTIAAYPC